MIPLTVGDINGDKKINIRDVVAMPKYFMAHLDLVDPFECSYTYSCLSELKISGRTATCSSFTIGYSEVYKIVIDQTLQKRNSKGKWITIKKWSSTVRNYCGAVKKTQKGLAKGTYRLMSKSIVISRKESETVIKYSRTKAVK